MKVTREVIYDLLPHYFAGDVSADTRALIEEFFASDPEFGRMAERFRTMMAERPPNGMSGTEADREKSVFDRARARVKLRQAAVVWGKGSAFALGIAVLTGFDGRLGARHPGVIIAIVFGAMALGTWLLSCAPHPEYWYAHFSGTDRASSGR